MARKIAILAGVGTYDRKLETKKSPPCFNPYFDHLSGRFLPDWNLIRAGFVSVVLWRLVRYFILIVWVTRRARIQGRIHPIAIGEKPEVARRAEMYVHVGRLLPHVNSVGLHTTVHQTVCPIYLLRRRCSYRSYCQSLLTTGDVRTWAKVTEAGVGNLGSRDPRSRIL